MANDEDIKIGLSTVGADAAAAEIKKVPDAISQVPAATTPAGSGIDGLRAKLESLEQRAEALKNEAGETTEAVGQMPDAMDDAADAAGRMDANLQKITRAQTAQIIGQLAGQVGQFGDKFREVAGDVREFDEGLARSLENAADVHGGQVEIELADITGSKSPCFQLDDDVTAELEVVEKEIERVVLAADFKPYLPPDEGEAGAKRDEEFLDVIDEGLLHLGLPAGIGRAEEVEEVGVFEKLCGHVGLRRWHGEVEVVLGLARTEVELVLDLDFEDAAAPALGKGLADVEIANGGVFDHLDEADDLAPGQL